MEAPGPPAPVGGDLPARDLSEGICRSRSEEEGLASISENSVSTFSEAGVATLSETSARYRGKQVVLAPIKEQSGASASSASSAPFSFNDAGGSEPEADQGAELALDTPGSSLPTLEAVAPAAEPELARPSGVLLDPEERDSLVSLIAESTANMLAADLRAALKPMLDEQERRLVHAFLRIRSQPPASSQQQFGLQRSRSGGAQRGAAQQGRAPPTPESSPSPERSPSPSSSASRLQAKNFTTAPVPTRTATPVEPSSHSERARTFDPIMPMALVRQISPFRRQAPAERQAAGASTPPRTVTPTATADELKVGRVPSAEGSQNKSNGGWSRFKNIVAESVGLNAGPSIMQTLEEARNDELLATMAEAAPPPPRGPTSDGADTDGQRHSKTGTLTRLMHPFPTRVATCPDVPGTASGSSGSKSGAIGAADYPPQNLVGLNTIMHTPVPVQAEEYVPARNEREKEERERKWKEAYDRSFLVRIDRRGSPKKLGLDVKREGDMLVITAIHAEGLVAAVSSCLSTKVLVGDRILEVNGSRSAILETLSTSQALHLRLVRGDHANPSDSTAEASEALSDDRPVKHSNSGVSQGSARNNRRTTTTRSRPETSAEAESDEDQPGFRRQRSGSPSDGYDSFSGTGQDSADSAALPSRARGGRGRPITTEEAARQAVEAFNGRRRSARLDSGTSKTSNGSRSESNIRSRDSSKRGSKKPPEQPEREGKRRFTGGFNKSEATTLRMECEDELLNVLHDAGTESMEVGRLASNSSCYSEGRGTAMFYLERKVCSPWLLCICGILPFERACYRLYQQLVALVAIGCVVVFALKLCYASATASQDCPSTGFCVDFHILSDAVLAVGSLLCMLALRALHSANLLGSSGLLVSYSRRQDVTGKWLLAARWHSLQIFVLWVLSLAFRVKMSYPIQSSEDVMGFVAFVLTSIFFAGITYTILHTTSAIAIMIDSYCLLLNSQPDLVKGIREWNMLQALVRKASRAVERGFMILQTTALAVLMVSATSIFLDESPNFWWLSSNVLLAFSVGLSFYKAAEVTEKCNRVPPLVNSLTFDTDMDHARHYLVEYVTYSMAGFYVGEVRLTAPMALKITYISSILAFGMLTRLPGRA